jgi:exopolyphosphatase / guanosine-5'-triphosphate,3'-diphosphate pyrophosphatase
MTDTELIAASSEVLAFMMELEPEPAHVQQVARLALDLFDQLTELHGCGVADRFLLEAAALLHDIGWTAASDGKAHHKHSARLIRERSWTTLAPAAVEVIAQIARYHRKSLPAPEHEEFAALPADDQLRVEKLAALLRIADGLDRQHLQKVAGLQTEVQAGAVSVWVKSEAPIQEELMAAKKKADLAERVFARSCCFAQVV